MTGIIVLLGAPNDALGNLSSIAVERCSLAADIYKGHTGFSILPTGGFGNFNRANKPHAHYTRTFLLELGVAEKDLLEPALSRFTLEDATLSEPVVLRYSVKNLIVVTSDFHRNRAELIFGRIFTGYNVSVYGSKTVLPQAELELLKQHENEAVARLIRR